MKIVNVEPIVLSFPLEDSIQTSFGKMEKRTGVFVKVNSDTGEFGIGEIWNNFPSWGVYEKLSTLKYGIAPLLVGENPEEIGRINHKLHSCYAKIGLQWGALGPIYQSISGIDMALWDLVGKHYNKPIHRLLGGKQLDEIPVYASGLGPRPFESLVKEHQEKGITQYKLKVGAGKDTDWANLKKMRELIGADAKLMIDANQDWDRRSALQNINQFRIFDLTWVEEPLRCDDLEGLRMVRKQTGIPVAGGENFYGRRHMRRVLEEQAVDIIQPDLSKNGGLSESKTVVEMAAGWEIPYALHFLGEAVCLAASLQFAAAIPGRKILELGANQNPLRDDLFTDPFVIQDGKIKVPDGPGLGFKLNEDFVNYHRVNIDDLLF
jgi:L-alanine-DL-glutamate epimerase-like enolase superfamily enzyme